MNNNKISNLLSNKYKPIFYFMRNAHKSSFQALCMATRPRHRNTIKHVR